MVTFAADTKMHYPVMTEQQVAARWKGSLKTMRRWRRDKVGPTCHKLFHHVRFLALGPTIGLAGTDIDNQSVPVVGQNVADVARSRFAVSVARSLASEEANQHPENPRQYIHGSTGEKKPTEKGWFLEFLWPVAESNHGHADFQSAALPTELTGQEGPHYYGSSSHRQKQTSKLA